MAYKSFEELEVWKMGCRLAVRIYEVLKECRDFGGSAAELRTQIFSGIFIFLEALTCETALL